MINTFILVLGQQRVSGFEAPWGHRCFSAEFECSVCLLSFKIMKHKQGINDIPAHCIIVMKIGLYCTTTATVLD